MFDRYDSFSQTAVASTICQDPSLFRISNTLATVQSFTNSWVDTRCPLYPCPHKDLFRIARQIDALPSIECRYQYVHQIFNIVNTERDKVIGILGKDTIANQIILQGVDDDRRFVRLITIDLDCDLLALIKGREDITGLYKVNSVGDA